VSSIDPLEPKIYAAEVPFVTNTSAYESRNVPAPVRAPGQPISWLAAGLVAVAILVVSALLQTVELLISPSAPVGAPIVLIMLPWVRAHMLRPRHRWWAFGVAFTGLVVLSTIIGPPYSSERLAAYLQDCATALIIMVYVAVTHIPRRQRPDTATSAQSTHVPTPAGQARRAAGTTNVRDGARLFLTDRTPRQPADDLVDLEHGAILFVSAPIRRGRRFKPGRLVLQRAAPDPLEWQPYRLFRGYGTGTVLPRPYVITKVGPVSGPGSRWTTAHLFELVTMQAAGEVREFAVPRIDVDLVRAALADR
jgi:hypothetical protein